MKLELLEATVTLFCFFCCWLKPFAQLTPNLQHFRQLGSVFGEQIIQSQATQLYPGILLLY